MTPIGLAVEMKEGATDHEDRWSHAKLVVILVIDLQEANYMKLVTRGYVSFGRHTGICNGRRST
jgi:hypothetical protein